MLCTAHCMHQQSKQINKIRWRVQLYGLINNMSGTHEDSALVYWIKLGHEYSRESQMEVIKKSL